ncbi:MAG: DUF2927 domain-containing protein [Alphaproteobacteria bacterium]
MAPADAFLKDYATVAFYEEGASFQDRKLMRWCRPVSVYLPESLPDAAAASAAETLDWLAGTEGLSLTMPGDPAMASLVVKTPATTIERDRIVDETFPHDRYSRRRMKKATCFFEISTEVNGCILRGSVVVPAYHTPALQTHCMAEELVQAMGLPNDGSFGPESVFSSGSAAVTASPRDRLFVRLHYHPGLRPGMSRQEALAAARRNATDLLSEADRLEPQ